MEHQIPQEGQTKLLAGEYGLSPDNPTAPETSSGGHISLVEITDLWLVFPRNGDKKSSCWAAI